MLYYFRYFVYMAAIVYSINWPFLIDQLYGSEYE